MFDVLSTIKDDPEYVRFVKRTKKAYFGDVFEEKFKVICDHLMSLPGGTKTSDIKMMDELFGFEKEFRIPPIGTAYHIIYLFKDFFIDQWDMFYFFSIRNKFADYHGINFLSPYGNARYLGCPYFLAYIIEHDDTFNPTGTYISEAQRMKVKSLVLKYKNFQPKPFEQYNQGNAEDFRDDYILSVLNLIKPKNDKKLLLGSYGCSNYETYIAFEGEDGCLSVEKERNKLLENVAVPYSVNGIWQAFVLSELWCTALPLGWHSNYSRKEYVLTERVYTNKGTYVPERSEYDFDTFYVSKHYFPKVTLNDDHSAEIQLCVWNDWHGLALATITAKWDKGTVRFSEPNMQTLVEFDCGKVF